MYAVYDDVYDDDSDDDDDHGNGIDDCCCPFLLYDFRVLLAVQRVIS